MYVADFGMNNALHCFSSITPHSPTIHFVLGHETICGHNRSLLHSYGGCHHVLNFE